MGIPNFDQFDIANHSGIELFRKYAQLQYNFPIIMPIPIECFDATTNKRFNNSSLNPGPTPFDFLIV